MIRLVISGCCGKMGSRIAALAKADKAFELVGTIEEQAHAAIGKKLGDVLGNPALNIEVTDNPEIIKGADALIEFTNPGATLEHLILALKHKKAVVIGTTGLSAAHLQKLKKASRKIPIVFSPNMSVGVNLVFRLVKESAQRLDQGYKVDIIEAHHIHKKDAPSGTAKRLVKLIKQTPSRKNENIEIDSIREDEIVGEHQVRFSGAEDTIIIKHSAKTRDIFAQGALAAARFVAKQACGLYDMQDVIG